MAAEEARRLPDRAIELPMLAVSTALQASLRAQQHYARLTARGDDVIHRRQVTDEPPPWATFDEPVGADELRKAAEHAAPERHTAAKAERRAAGGPDASVKPLRRTSARKPRPADKPETGS
jgi:hypothetical protein